jgi:hypothetical protein
LGKDTPIECNLPEFPVEKLAARLQVCQYSRSRLDQDIKAPETPGRRFCILRKS